MADALNIITNNPFRILGIPETSNKRLIQKRIDEFEVYNAIGKYPKSEIDFSWIGKINRNNESIDLAKEAWIKKTLHKVKLRSNKQIQIKPVDIKYAKIYLLGRLQEMAQQHAFKYNRATIRNQKTRWGSCSIKNNISLNMQLMNLPPELVDYVILHELVHTKFKNHSPIFWSMLNKYVGNAKLQNKLLKKFILNPCTS